MICLGIVGMWRAVSNYVEKDKRLLLMGSNEFLILLREAEIG